LRLRRADAAGGASSPREGGARLPDDVPAAAQFRANRLVRRENGRAGGTGVRRRRACPTRARTAAAARAARIAARDAFAKNALFSASDRNASGSRAGGGRAARRVAAGARVVSPAARRKKNRARVLTVKKTVIRFRPADAACRSE